jgi:Tol biopolymer transport system component
MATDGTVDRQLFSNDPKAQIVDWTPDGKALVFLSDRSGTRALWHVAVEEGRVPGEALILRTGMASEIFPVGIGADGRLLFVENSGLNNSYVIPLAGGAPMRLTRRFEGSNGFASYSPDGNRLAWFGLKEQFSVRGSTLVVQDRASGTEKTLPTPGGAVMNFAPQWLNDNRSMVFLVSESSKDTLVKLDVETEHTSKIVDARRMMGSLLSPDGKAYYFANREEGHIVALDLATGAERKIADVTPHRLVRAFVVNYPSHLPDSTGFVGWSLELCDLARGKVSIFRRGDFKDRHVGFFRRTLQFTPDGKALIAATGGEKPNLIRLLPLDGGPSRILVQSTGLLFDASVSPDGKSLAYTESTTKNDLWVLEEFLPKASAQKR